MARSDLDDLPNDARTLPPVASQPLRKTGVSLEPLQRSNNPTKVGVSGRSDR